MANRGPPALLRRQQPLARRHEANAAAAVRELEFGINNLGRGSMAPRTPPLRMRLPVRPLGGQMAASGMSQSAARTARRRANLRRQMLRRVRSGRVNKYY